MVKIVSKVSVYKWFHHVGRYCGGHVNICYCKGFKDLLHFDFKVNRYLVSLLIVVVLVLIVP